MIEPPGAKPYGAEPPAAVRRRTNRFAIVALITGLAGMLLFAVGFAIAAFVQINRRGEKGRGLAAAGIAASVAWVAAITVAVVAGMAENPADKALASDFGQPRASTLKAGTCFIGFEDKGAGIFMRAAPCKGPHEGEIGARATLRERPYPGDREVLAEAEKLCRDRTAFLEKTGRADDFRLYIDRPDKGTWGHGDRAVTCVLRYIGSSYLVLPIKDLLTGPRDYTDLVPGDCVKAWDESDVVTVVGCTKPHKMQVFAVFELDGDTFPSIGEMDDRAGRGCADRALRIWGPHGFPRNVEPSYVGPNSVAWEQDERQIVCMVEAVKGSLKRSLLPK
ncbi:DUF4190 domain-containing protein [Actinomadura chokoriensis]|uniref:DUF4190 domain-containing protein n=1 Tax=Actinomadura chokoriensis TaxID=454156 RepID=UPI0031F7D6EE